MGSMPIRFIHKPKALEHRQNKARMNENGIILTIVNKMKTHYLQGLNETREIENKIGSDSHFSDQGPA